MLWYATRHYLALLEGLLCGAINCTILSTWELDGILVLAEHMLKQSSDISDINPIKKNVQKSIKQSVPSIIKDADSLVKNLKRCWEYIDDPLFFVNQCKYFSIDDGWDLAATDMGFSESRDGEALFSDLSRVASIKQSPTNKGRKSSHITTANKKINENHIKQLFFGVTETQEGDQPIRNNKKEKIIKSSPKTPIIKSSPKKKIIKSSPKVRKALSNNSIKWKTNVKISQLAGVSVKKNSEESLITLDSIPETYLCVKLPADETCVKNEDYSLNMESFNDKDDPHPLSKSIDNIQTVKMRLTKSKSQLKKKPITTVRDRLKMKIRNFAKHK